MGNFEVIGPYLQIFWDEVGRAIIVYSLPVFIVSYLAKKVITHWLDKDIESYKESLKNTTNLEFERYKNQLQKDQLRLQISYGGIFEKQANAILDIYKAMIHLEYSATMFINSNSNKEDESSQLFFQSWCDTNESYSNNRILLPEQLDAELNKFIHDYFMNVHHYTMAKEDLKNLNRVHGVSDEELDWIRKQKKKANAMINNDIPKLKESIISIMRKTLGSTLIC
ncbi:MAG: hypothetical protein NTX45_09915 [Proteobacteria bacterium]|nr:hypothetical protein [Pseudomonadota bacterium]